MASGMGGYLGILKWSLQYNDGTSPSPATEMDEKTKTWLQECIESVSMDPLDEVKILLKVLEIDSADQPTESKQEVLKKKGEALDDIGEYLEDLNLAEGFLSLNGLQTMTKLLEDEHAVIRSGAARVLAAVVQNFEKTQQSAMDIGLLETLVNRLHVSMKETATVDEDADDSASDVSDFGADSTEKLKLVLALSCLVRGHERATLEFLNKHAGFDVLAQVLSTSLTESDKVTASRLQQKLLFFLEFLLSERLPAFTKLVNAEKFYEVVRKCMVVTDNDMVRERVLRLLSKVAGSAEARAHMTADVRESLLEDLGKLIETIQREINESKEEDNSYAEEVRALAEDVASKLGAEPDVPVVESSESAASSEVLLLK